MRKVITFTREYKSVLYGAKEFDPMFQVKAVDDAEGIIQAYASKFDNVDEYKDVVCPGSYKRTLLSAKASKRAYIYPYLFQHDPGLIVGGIKDAQEDHQGLLYWAQCNLETQLGRETYSNAKMGVLYQSSIGYDVPQGGAEYKDGIRYLKEIRLWEISLVTFAANPEATVVDVKQSPIERPYEILTKSASGSPDWPLGDRKTAWDGQTAHNAIVKWASDDDGSIDVSKMKSVHFWYDESAPDKITSYKLAFCDIVDGKPIAMPKGIFACAGSHGVESADIPESDVAGVKAKIAAYYSRMAKEFDDDSIKVPWSDEKSKGKCMNRQMKTLMEHYNEEMAEDMLEDWQDVFLCALTCAVLDAFKIGDQPAQDISQALDDFKTLVMEKFVAQGIEVGLSQYLTDNSYSPADYTMQYGSESQPDYGYMSSSLARQSKRRARKAGRAISAANGDKIQGAVDSLHDMADKMIQDMKMHAKSVHTAADDLATVLQGSEAAYGSDSGTPEEGQQEGKSKQFDRELESALSNLRALRA